MLNKGNQHNVFQKAAFHVLSSECNISGFSLNVLIITEFAYNLFFIIKNYNFKHKYTIKIHIYL